MDKVLEEIAENFKKWDEHKIGYLEVTHHTRLILEREGYLDSNVVNIENVRMKNAESVHLRPQLEEDVMSC